MKNKIAILFFGTGIGGGTFYIEDFLNEVSGFAITPNVGIIALCLEEGLIGLFLLLAPFSWLIILLIIKMLNQDGSNGKWEMRFMLSLAISTMTFMLASSGIGLGFQLSIGSLLGGINFKKSEE